MSDDAVTTDLQQGEPHPKRRRSATEPARRDAEAARAAAAKRVELAQKVADSVSAFHNAADRIDAAQAELAAASQDRLAAIRQLRDAKLTITEISDLTGLSSSRIQALIRGID